MTSIEDRSQNHEMQLIFEISKEIFQKTGGIDIFSKPDRALESYFTAPDIPKLFYQNVFDYDFSTPVQLKALVEKMWIHQGCDIMLKFPAVVTVATFKNREARKSVDAGIPSYVYAF